jgi:hypothetical protein
MEKVEKVPIRRCSILFVGRFATPVSVRREVGHHATSG